MAEESLLSAARRALRDFNIDMNKGGLITTATEISFITLGKEVEKEDNYQKALAAQAGVPWDGEFRRGMLAKPIDK